MRIGLITSVPLVPPWDQGDKNLAYAIASALPGMRFAALTTRDGPATEVGNLEPQPVYRSRRPSLMEKAGVYRWMLAGGPKPRPDLYHFVYQPTRLSSWALRWLPEIRRCPVVHTVPATTEGHPLLPSLFFADRVVAISGYGQRALSAAGVRPVDHVPHGIPVDRWAALADQCQAYKAELDLDDRMVVLYPGHLGAQYGIDHLLQALVEVRKAVPEVVVLLACRPRSRGEFRRRTTLRSMVLAAGLGEAVRWFETVQDMRVLIGASDLLVLPFQTMRDKIDIPTTLLEALAAGKPVIVSDIPPMNEVISHHGVALDPASVGLLVAPGSAECLAKAMIRLLTSPDERGAMGRRGAHLARERYDIGQIAKQYEQIYLEVLA